MPLRAGVARRVAVAVAVLAWGSGALSGCAADYGRHAGSGGMGPTTRMVAGGNTLDQAVAPAAVDIPLVDQAGHAFSLRSLRGQIVVLAPFLTMCQETCPMTSANLHEAAQAALGADQAGHQDGHVVFLEVTVDPQRYTVRRLHAYARLYGALPDWKLATGRPSEVLALWRALGISTDKTKPDDTVRDWMSGKLVHDSYDVHHQDVVMVIDPMGRLRWVTDGHPDARGASLPTTLRRFLNDEGRSNYAHPGAHGASSWTAAEVEQAVAYVRGAS